MEFRPDPRTIRADRLGQLRWMALAGAMAVFAASYGTLGGSLFDTRPAWAAPASFAAAAVALGFVGVTVWKNRSLGRVVKDGYGLALHPEGLVLPGEQPVDWGRVLSVVAHRLDWAGVEVITDQGRTRVYARHFGATVDALVEAFSAYTPVGDPDAAYRDWGRHWSGG